MLKKIAKLAWRKSPPIFRQIIVRLTQHKFTVSVAAVIINDEDEVLLLDHVLRPASSWGFPGGFLNRDEQPEEAVKRELREETGIELSEIEIIRARTFNRHVEILFRAKSSGRAEVKSLEINAVGWFKVDKLPKNMSRSQKLIVERLLKNEP